MPQLSDLEALVAEIQRKNSELEAQLDGARTGSSVSARDAQARTAELSREIANLRKQLQVSNQTLVEVKERHSTCDHRIAEASEKAESAQRALEELKVKVRFPSFLSNSLLSSECLCECVGGKDRSRASEFRIFDRRPTDGEG